MGVVVSDVLALVNKIASVLTSDLGDFFAKSSKNPSQGYRMWPSAVLVSS